MASAGAPSPVADRAASARESPDRHREKSSGRRREKPSSQYRALPSPPRHRCPFRAAAPPSTRAPRMHRHARRRSDTSRSRMRAETSFLLTSTLLPPMVRSRVMLESSASFSSAASSSNDASHSIARSASARYIAPLSRFTYPSCAPAAKRSCSCPLQPAVNGDDQFAWGRISHLLKCLGRSENCTRSASAAADAREDSRPSHPLRPRFFGIYTCFGGVTCSSDLLPTCTKLNSRAASRAWMASFTASAERSWPGSSRPRPRPRNHAIEILRDSAESASGTEIPPLAHHIRAQRDNSSHTDPSAAV